jgi:hypothetical protein
MKARRPFRPAAESSQPRRTKAPCDGPSPRSVGLVCRLGLRLERDNGGAHDLTPSISASASANLPGSRIIESPLVGVAVRFHPVAGTRALRRHRGVAHSPAKIMREQMNCYAVMTISDAILDDSSRQNIACKTFGAQVLSLLSMLDSVSSNPASICNPTRLHSTHLRSRSVRPS